jgi:hypothetical protein
MPIKLIQSKSRMPESLQYNAWAPLSFQPIQVNSPSGVRASTLIQGIKPLGLNYKITHISYVMSDWVNAGLPTSGTFAAGKLAMNIVSGVGAYEGAGAASSYAYITLSGTFAANDKITITIAGVPYVYTVNARVAGSLQTVAAGLTDFLNRQSLNGNFFGFNTLYRANSLGAEIVIQTLAYSTATPTFTVAVMTSATGAAVASGATMIAGIAGALPVAPVSDTTNLGIVPSQVAAVGTALFPVDIVLPLFAGSQADVVGTVYALENFDANWPTLAEMTLRFTADGVVAGGLEVILWGVPNDVHPMQPEEAATAFHLSQIVL